jgi:hypothetical protein
MASADPDRPPEANDERPPPTRGFRSFSGNRRLRFLFLLPSLVFVVSSFLAPLLSDLGFPALREEKSLRLMIFFLLPGGIAALFSTREVAAHNASGRLGHLLTFLSHLVVQILVLMMISVILLVVAQIL